MYINNNNDSSKWILVSNKRNLDIWIVHMNLIIVLLFPIKTPIHIKTYQLARFSFN